MKKSISEKGAAKRKQKHGRIFCWQTLLKCVSNDLTRDSWKLEHCMLYLLREIILNFQESQVKSFETHFSAMGYSRVFYFSKNFKSLAHQEPELCAFEKRMNGSPTDPLSCHYCYDRVITPESGPRLNNRGISEISLTSYGAINQCYEDYEYNKYSPDSDLYAEQSISSAHRGILSLESRILRPYSAILKFLGMRAFRGEYIVHKVVSVMWPLVLFACLITGYVINYKVCQHDEPSDEHKHETKSHEKFKEICYNVTIPYIYMDSVCDNTLDSIIPSVLHFIAFFVTFWNFRVKRSEQVEALVQKCFVTSFFGTNTTTHKRQLNRCLKVYSLYGILSLVGLLFMTLLNSYFGKTFVLSECLQNYNFNAVEKYFMGIGYAIPMFLMHVTYFPILINYIMQSRLIGFLINELRELLREKRTTLKVIMQEAHDTSTFIHKLNYESSPATSLMVFYLFYGLFIDLRVIATKTQGAGGLYSLWYYDCDGNEGVWIQNGLFS
eukprot:sb/3464128/